MKALLPRLALGFVAAAVPLLFLPQLEDAYRLIQLAALSLGVVLLAVLTRDRVMPVASRGAWCVLAFFSWRLASLVVSGTPAHGAAWIAEQFLYVYLFLWGASLRQDLLSRLRFFLLSGLVLGSVYGLFQHFHSGARAYASLGNPDFWGSFVVLLLPLSLVSWLAGSGKSPGRTLGSALVPALLILSLLLSQTRAAWLGFLACLPLLLLHRRKSLNPARTLLALLAGLALVLVFSFPNPLNPSGLSSAGRFLSSFSTSHSAAQDRLFMGRIAADLANLHPLWGVGPGNLASEFLAEQGRHLVLPEYFHQPYLFTTVVHDDWLQVAAESGWPALVLLVLSLGLAMNALWRRKDDLSGAVMAGLVALAVSAFFSFPLSVVPTTAFFWLFVGMAFKPDEKPSSPQGITRWWPVLPALAACALFIRLLFANAVLHQGINLELAGEPSRSLAYLDKAARLDPQDYRAWFHLGRAAGKLGEFPQAASYYTRALRLFPNHPDAWAGLGLELGKENRLPAAEQACRRALSLNPRSREAWGNLGKVHYLSRRSTLAKSDYRQGLAVDPSWAEGYFNLGAIYYNEGNTVEASRLFNAALALDPAHEGSLAGLEKIRSLARHL